MLLGRVIVDRIFGFDVFVSYSRRDGTAYAQQLEEELRRGGYRSFLDSKEMPAGEALTASLRNALKRSSALILVASPGALLSQYMPKEFDYYVEARQRPKIVPISIGRALDDAGPDLPLSQRVRARADVIWITEREEQLAKGPSAGVLKRLNDSSKFTRRNTLRERVVSGVVVILLALLAIAVWQWSRAGQERDAARQTLSRSYFTRACRLLDSKNYYDGLAYLVAACRADPENASAAATRLFALLTERNWLLPLTPPMPDRDSENHGQVIERIRFSANGTLLVTTNFTEFPEHEGVARVWDAKNGKLLVDAIPCNSSGEDEYTPFLPDADSFSPQADKLLVACGPKVELWDVPQPKTVGAPHTYELRTGSDKNVTAARFLPDGKTILVGTEDGTIVAFTDWPNPPLTLKAGGKVERFSREGQRVLARNGEGALQLLQAAPDWKTLHPVGNPLPAGKLLATDETLRLAVLSEAKSPDAGSETSNFLVWRPGAATPDATPSMDQGETREAVSISPNLQQLAALGTTRNQILGQTVTLLRTWTSSESEPNWQPPNSKIKTHDATQIDPESGFDAYQLRFSPDSLRIASVGRDKSVRVWDADSEKNEPLYVPLRTESDFSTVDFRFDGKRLATGSYGGIARVWDLHLTAVQPEPQTLATDVKDYAITSDGRVVVIVHSHGGREAFDLETGRRVTVSKDEMEKAFKAKANTEADADAEADSKKADGFGLRSPNGTRRLVGDKNKRKLSLRVETTGQPLADNLRALNGAAAFSRSGGLLALIDSPTTSEGDWLYLIDAETGKPKRDRIRLRNPTTQAMSDGTTSAINFRADDKQLVTGTGEVIDVATGEHLTEQIIPVAGDYFWLSNKALHVFTCDDGRAQLRHFELILDAAPEALLDIGTAVAEAQVNGNGALERSETIPAQLQKIAGSLSADTTDPVTKWARWFLDLDNPETPPAQSGGPVSPGENFKEMKSEKQQNTEETTVAPAASDQHQSP